MSELPAELPLDIVEMLTNASDGTTIDGPTAKAVTLEIARRYRVSQIDALRAVHNWLGGVPANARVNDRAPDTAYTVDRPSEDTRYRIELYRAPLGSRFEDEYRLIAIDIGTGTRSVNSNLGEWESAAEMARVRYGIAPDEWRLDNAGDG